MCKRNTESTANTGFGRIKVMKILLSFLIALYATNCYAKDKFVNVFVIVDNSANIQIQQVNELFKNNGIYNRYTISPFSDNHLVHMTMYLTYYDEKTIPKILEQVHLIAKNTHQFSAQTKELELKPSNFLMLNIVNSNQLQNLSNSTVLNLYSYRSKNIIIPEYAKHDPAKIKLFEKYGSPSVYNGFEPHFSIFYAKIPKNQQNEFQNDVNQAISTVKLSQHDIKIIGLGVGIADVNGQITKVIKTYKLA